MRTDILRLLCVAICLPPLFVRAAYAQGCRLDYTPHYAVYVTESSNGTNIYTTVLTDGSTSGNASAGCNYPNATHTPKSYNMLGSVGGWKNGNPGYMTSYLSIENDEDIVGVPGVIYPFVGDGEIDCSVFGTFFSAGESGQVELATTKVKTDFSNPITNQPIPGGLGAVKCATNSWCTPATTPPDCPVSLLAQQPIIMFTTASCSSYYLTYWLAERPSSNTAWTCTSAYPSNNSFSTPSTAQASCTHNPPHP